MAFHIYTYSHRINYKITYIENWNIYIDSNLNQNIQLKSYNLLNIPDSEQSFICRLDANSFNIEQYDIYLKNLYWSGSILEE